MIFAIYLFCHYSLLGYISKKKKLTDLTTYKYVDYTLPNKYPWKKFTYLKLYVCSHLTSVYRTDRHLDTTFFFHSDRGYVSLFFNINRYIEDDDVLKNLKIVRICDLVYVMSCSYFSYFNSVNTTTAKHISILFWTSSKSLVCSLLWHLCRCCDYGLAAQHTWLRVTRK